MEAALRSRASGVVVIAVVGGWLSCAPGKFPCDSPEWAAECNPDGASTPPASDGAVATVNRDTPIFSCDKYKTLGEMDAFFSMRCGVGAASGGCHYNPLPWTDLRMMDVWQRLRDLEPKVVCNKRDSGGKALARIIDTRNWENSILLTKTRPVPDCPPGSATGSGSTGAAMPPPLELQSHLPDGEKQRPLDDQERACLRAFVQAAAGQGSNR